MNIEGAVALVTGANRGLGRVLVEQLRARGARKVYAGARDPSKIKYPGVEPIKLDITNASDVGVAAKALGDVNLVINNAGGAHFSSLAADSSMEIARAAIGNELFRDVAHRQRFRADACQERRRCTRKYALCSQLDHLPVACRLLRVEIGRLGAHQCPAAGNESARHACRWGSRRADRYRYGRRGRSAESYAGAGREGDPGWGRCWP